MTQYHWGDERVDWDAINNCCHDMWWWTRKVGRMGGDIKEKYGSVRFYAWLGYLSLHGLIYPGYVGNQFPLWLWRLDRRVIGPVLRFFFGRLFSWYHRKFYSWLYRRMIKKYPTIEAAILSDADYPELIEGHYRREGRNLYVLDSKGEIVATWTSGPTKEELEEEEAKAAKAAFIKASAQQILEARKAMFTTLANGITCPACNKMAQPPFVNLGEKYNWREGHPECLTLTESK